MQRHSLLIIGCGDLGLRVTASLDRAQWDITGVRRNPPVTSEYMHWVAADYAEPGSLDFAAELRPDFVLCSFTPTSRDPAGYRRGFREAAVNVLRGLGEHRPRLLIMASSTRVYAETAGGWVDETSPLASTDPFALEIIAAEQAFLCAGLPATVVRFGGIYGGVHSRLIDKVASGRVAPVRPVRYTNRIHREDCAGFLAHLLTLSLAGAHLEAVYNGTDDDPATAHEVESWIAARLGCESVDARPQPQERDAGHKRCRNDRLRATGYQLRYPDFRSGYLNQRGID